VASPEDPKDVFNISTAKKLYSLETFDRLVQLTLEHQKIIKDQQELIERLYQSNKKLD
jgi:hypothetical protein